MATAPKRKAKNNDPATWASYETAVAAAKTADGIGFALLDTPYVAVDLDHCLDGDEIDPWAKALVEEANGAYIERTPSGEGLRIIGLGSGEKLHRKWKIEGAREGAAVEVYRACERYITITGAQIGECEATIGTRSARQDCIQLRPEEEAEREGLRLQQGRHTGRLR